MTFRLVSAVVALLLAVAAGVNLNDPDPKRWVAIYGAAGAVSIAVAWRGAVWLTAPAAVGAVAFAWAVLWARRVRSWNAYSRMLDSWQMKSVEVEEARETTGLFLVAVWMAFVALHTWRSAR